MASDDSYSLSRCFTPVLKRCVVEVCTSLNPGGIAIVKSVGPFSSQDVYGMHSALFNSASAGEEVLELGKRVLEAQESVPGKPGSSSGNDNVFGEARVDDIFKARMPRLKPYELGQLPSHAAAGSSGMRAAREAIDTIVEEIVALMDDRVREAFLDGYMSLPAEVRGPTLIRLVRCNKSIDHFKGVRDALLRFKRWNFTRFGVFRGFEAKEAYVAWFFLDNLVSDALDGHASKSLYAGLKAASDTTHRMQEPVCPEV